MSGDRVHGVLFEPLHGGSPEGRVTWARKLHEECEGRAIAGVSRGKVPPQGFFEDPMDTVAGQHCKKPDTEGPRTLEKADRDQLEFELFPWTD